MKKVINYLLICSLVCYSIIPMSVYGAELNENSIYITRGEAARKINQLFEYVETADRNFNDIENIDPYFKEVLIAKGEGYYLGDDTGAVKADTYLTKEQSATVMQRLFKLESHNYQMSTVETESIISSWAMKGVEALKSIGLIRGDLNHRFEPKAYITESEFLAQLDQLASRVYNESNIYEDEIIDGNALITTADVTLKNVVIKGSLFISSGVEEGEVYLDGVKVENGIYVSGGGENSIYLKDVEAKHCNVKKVNGKAHLVASGKTTIDELGVSSGVIIEEKNLTSGGSGFIDARVEGSMPLEHKVSFLGDFDQIDIKSRATVELNRCRVKSLRLSKTLEHSLEAHLNQQVESALSIVSSTIQSLILDAQGVKISLRQYSKIGECLLNTRTTLELSRTSKISKLTIEESAEGTEVNAKGTINEVNSKAEIITVNGKEWEMGTVANFNGNNEDEDGDDSSNNSSSSGGSSTDDLSEEIFIEADDTNNYFGEAITLLCADNTTWMSNITELLVDGRPLPIANVMKSSGQITLNPASFIPTDLMDTVYSASKDFSEENATLSEQRYHDYNVVIKSSGFKTLSVTQRVYEVNRATLNVSDVSVYRKTDYGYLNYRPIEMTEEIGVGGHNNYAIGLKLEGSNAEVIDSNLVEGQIPIWSTQDETVATVTDNGVVRAISNGETTIRCEYGGFSFNIPVKVAKIPPSILKDETNLTYGQQIELKPNPLNTEWLEGITEVHTKSGTVPFTTSSSAINFNSNDLDSNDAIKEYIYSPSEGTMLFEGKDLDVISRKTNDWYNIAVDSEDYLSSKVWQDINQQSDTLVGIKTMTIKNYQKDFEMVLGEESTNKLFVSMELTDGRTVEPGNTRNQWIYYYKDFDYVNMLDSEIPVNWQTSNSNIVSISPEGRIEAHGAGYATITATYGSTVAETIIEVKHPAPVISVQQVITTGSAVKIQLTGGSKEWFNHIEEVYVLNENLEEIKLEAEHFTTTGSSILISEDMLLNNYPRNGEQIYYISKDSAMIKASQDTYAIGIKSTNYRDAIVYHPIATTIEEVVKVHHDPEATLGKKVQLRFEEAMPSSDLKHSIVGMTINDVQIPHNRFQVANDKILIDAKVFTSKGAYVIKINVADSANIFGLDYYWLEVVQTINDPIVESNEIVFFRNDDKIYAVSEGCNATTSSALVFTNIGGQEVEATFDKTITTSGESIQISMFDLDNKSTNNFLSIDDAPVIQVTLEEVTTTSAAITTTTNAAITTNTAIHYSIWGADQYDVVDIIHPGNLSNEILNGQQIKFLYKDQPVLTYTLSNKKFIVNQ